MKMYYLKSFLLYGSGDDGDGGDVPDLVHLIAQLGSRLDPKCDTKIKIPYLTGIPQVSRTQIAIFFLVRMPWH